MSSVIDISSVTSLYLYGTLTPPSDLNTKLRPSASIGVEAVLDVKNYMAVVGRTTNLFQTNVVQDFFAGSFDLSSFAADTNGNRTASFAEIISKNIMVDSRFVDIHSGQVSISQYVTEIGSDDWAMRAYIFGSTSFVLSPEDILFKIAANGERSIAGGAMLPYNTDFDLTSTSYLARAYNYQILHDILDPYDIGRTVTFTFSDADKDAYAEAALGNVYHAQDEPSLLTNLLAGVVNHVFDLPDDIADLLAGNAQLKSDILNAAQYIVDDIM